MTLTESDLNQILLKKPIILTIYYHKNMFEFKTYQFLFMNEDSPIKMFHNYTIQESENVLSIFYKHRILSNSLLECFLMFISKKLNLKVRLR